MFWMAQNLVKGFLKESSHIVNQNNDSSWIFDSTSHSCGQRSLFYEFKSVKKVNMIVAIEGVIQIKLIINRKEESYVF